MTSCRDNAGRYLRELFSSADDILELWEAFVAQCPEILRGRQWVTLAQERLGGGEL